MWGGYEGYKHWMPSGSHAHKPTELAPKAAPMVKPPVAAQSEAVPTHSPPKNVEPTQEDAQTQYQLGIKFYNAKNYDEALKWLRLAAEKGDARAQNYLGLMYSFGNGVRKDYAEAMKWFDRAVKQGLALAQYNLGWMHHEGWGVKRDNAEAVKWFRLAAEQKLAVAQYMMGFMYKNGCGVPKDLNEARKWYQLAANQGDIDAQAALVLINTH